MKERRVLMKYTDQPTLARAFRSWRQEHGYRISEAARVTGIPATTIQRIEEGSFPRVKNLERIARAFHMTTAEIFTKYLDNKKDQ